MAEQHDAPDPQALLALLDELAVLEGHAEPGEWIAKARYGAALFATFPRILAGVRALVAENARLREALTTLAREAEAVNTKFHLNGRCQECGAQESQGHYGMCALYHFRLEAIAALAGGKEDAGG